MEQKMLLPIVVIVLVGGFIIGYYAASFGGGGKAKASPAVQSSATLLGTELEDSFVTSATYTESLVGYIQSLDASSITITREGKAVTIPLHSNTVVTRYVSGNKIVVPSGYPKPGDYVNVRTLTNADTKELMSTSITVLKRAALK